MHLIDKNLKTHHEFSEFLKIFKQKQKNSNNSVSIYNALNLTVLHLQCLGNDLICITVLLTQTIYQKHLSYKCWQDFQR